MEIFRGRPKSAQWKMVIVHDFGGDMAMFHVDKNGNCSDLSIESHNKKSKGEIGNMAFHELESDQIFQKKLDNEEKEFVITFQNPEDISYEDQITFGNFENDLLDQSTDIDIYDDIGMFPY